MIRMSEHQHTPLWRQLLGAATGAIVALLLYVGFAAASPNLSTVAAYLLGDFEEKVENMPAHPQSPRTVRDGAIARREALGDRARAATARLQKGENYFKRGASSSSALSLSSVAPIPSVAKERGEVPQNEAVSQKDHGKQRPEEKEKHADEKRAEEKLPDTGVPLWVIGGIAFCIAMSVRYRRELCGVIQRSGS